jgi:hypothetical protein
MASLLKWQQSFPTFVEVRIELQLEQIKMVARPDCFVSALVALYLLLVA